MADKILSIAGNIITLEHNLQYSYTTAASAYLTTISSVFLIDGKDDITIDGGEYDGNKSNYPLIQPVSMRDAGLEESRTGCAISVIGSNRIKVKNINAYDFS